MTTAELKWEEVLQNISDDFDAALPESLETRLRPYTVTVCGADAQNPDECEHSVRTDDGWCVGCGKEVDD